MNIRTGQTVYQDILSLDIDNNPVTSGVTFDAIAILNGAEYTGATVNMSLIDTSRGLFLASWSSNTIGDYQIYVKNNATNVIFVSDSVNLRPDSEFDNIVYIGL